MNEAEIKAGEADDEEEEDKYLSLKNNPGLNVLYNLPAIANFIDKIKFMQNIWPVVTKLESKAAC